MEYLWNLLGYKTVICEMCKKEYTLSVEEVKDTVFCSEGCFLSHMALDKNDKLLEKDRKESCV